MEPTFAYGHHGRIFDIAFAPNTEEFVTASEDCTARVWRQSSSGYQQAICLTGHEAEVMRASWNHDGEMIATGSADTTARIWKLQDGYASECVAQLGSHKEELYCCEWLHCQRDAHFLTVSADVLTLWDISTQPRRLQDLQLKPPNNPDDIPELWRNTAAFGCYQAPHQAIAALPCSDGTVHIVSTGDSILEVLRVLAAAVDVGEVTMCQTAAFSCSGGLLAVVTHLGVVLVYDTKQWTVTYEVNIGRGIMAIKWIVRGGQDCMLLTHRGQVILVELPSGKGQAWTSQLTERRLLCLDVCTSTDVVAAAGEVVMASGDGDAEGGPKTSNDGMQDTTPHEAVLGEDQDLARLFKTNVQVSKKSRRGRKSVNLPTPASMVGRAPVELVQLAFFV